MTISRQSLCERAWLRNQSLGGAAAVVPIARYDALEPQARTLMAQKIAGDPNENVRNQLKKNFTLTVASGVADLTTAITASEPMMDQDLNHAIVTSADSTQPWQYLQDYSLLTLSRPTFGMVFFTVKNGSLICTDTLGALSSLTTTATASCSYVPLAATISGNLDLEELAIMTLAQLAAGMNNELPTTS